MTARILPALFLALLASTAIANPVRDGSLSATSNGTNITIRWLSEDETGVVRYELERKAGVGGSFVLVAQLIPRGNNSAYEYVDDSALRVVESVYQYQVKVVFSNGTPAMYYGPITVIHNVSSVRRTWGSIKAMFR